MKFVYIGIAALALGFASCSKEEIRPNDPVSDGEVSFFTKASSSNSNGEGILNDPTGGGNEGIVDPEKNEEESQLNDGQ